YIGRDSWLGIELDNGEVICATPDHDFMLRDGRMLPAAALRTGQSLMPLYRQPVRGYEMVYQPMSGHLTPTHRLANEWNLRGGIYEDIPGTLDDGTRRKRQAHVAREIRIRPEIDVERVRAALDQIGSGRGAARVLGCYRLVFRRLPDVIAPFRGRGSARNHKVVDDHDRPGDHE